ncbi:sigma-70 family RNA polymerase sigma factor [bacterium]|nr:sigma-70 family RNA polymerase sigma factor [bacterium]
MRSGELQFPPEARWARVALESGERLSSQEESEIIRACQAGDFSGFGLLVQRYRRLVWSAVDACGIEESQLEDVVQGAFMRAYEKLGSFRFASGFSSWLWRLSRNHALSQRRYLQRRPSPLSLEGLRQNRTAGPGGAGPLAAQAVGAGLAALSDASSAGADPQAQYTQAARQAALRSMLASLPADQREALNLYYVAEYSYEEIAQALSLPINTVRTKLYRARQRLMQIAAERGWDSLTE